MYNIIKFNKIDSTNSYALQEMENLNDEDIILADTQTKGKGRYNREWFSPPKKNLYFTICLKKSFNKEKTNFFTCTAAVAINKVLKNYNLNSTIKWPNDILVNNKKVGGILAEANKRGIALGIGLNVNMDKKLLKKIDQPATSLSEESKKDINREKVLNDILNNFFDLYELATSDNLEHIIKIWQDEIGLLKKSVVITSAVANISGVVTDIENDGTLIIDNGKKKQKVTSGDLKYISPQGNNGSVL